MDPQTQKYYSERIKDATNLYRTSRDDGIQKYFFRAFSPGSKILEIGTGSGRDLNILRNNGYDAYGIDLSPEMIKATHDEYPALKNYCQEGGIPSEKLFFEGKFDGILCSAVLMHISDDLLLDAAYTIKRNLKQWGSLLISVPLKRPDLDTESRISDGRLFILRPADYYSLLFERLGFKEIQRSEEADSMGRSDIIWSIQIFTLESEAVRSLDKIESVLNRDRKTATYKLALFRALADIAATEYNDVRWYKDGRVGVSLQNIAEKWLVYYWALFENKNFIPQINGEKPGCAMPVKFRKSLTCLTEEFRSRGGLNRFNLEYKNRRGKPDSTVALALKEISDTIKNGPVVYSGGASGEQIFYYDSKSGNILFSADIWRELCLMGHWIRDALILRWGELTSRMSGGEVLSSEVINLLLRQPSDERDTSQCRVLFNKIDNLECVWSGKSVKRAFDIDHVIPFALWQNNDVWNLMPADPKVNNSKRDKLPAKNLLENRKNIIIHYWHILYKEMPIRFSRDAERFTGRAISDNWGKGLFSVLVDAVEFTALQRGVERWSI